MLPRSDHWKHKAEISGNLDRNTRYGLSPNMSDHAVSPPPEPSKKPSGSLLHSLRHGGLAFSVGLIALYLVLGILGMSRHAMWRDEVFPWLLARNSASLPELFHNLRYDGPHFAVWHLILWVVSRWTHNIAAEQVVHLVLATTAVWLFVRCSPFSWKQKLLFGFGYFTLFEYCVICRMYVLVWLFMFLFCTAFATRRRTYLPLATILFVLANTTSYGTIMAVALATGLVAEFVLSQQKRAHYERRRWDPVAALSLFSVALFLVVVQMTHKAQDLPAEVMTGWWGDFHRTPVRLADALQNVWRAYVPVAYSFPYWPGFMWGTNMFIEWCSRWLPHYGLVVVALSVILVVISTVTLIRSPIALFVWGVGLGLLLAFQIVAGPGALRHGGLLFILYVVCLWLEHDPSGLKRSSPKLEKIAERWRNSFLTWILLIQAAGGVYAWSVDQAAAGVYNESVHYDCQFSGGKAAAAFIKANNFQRLLLVGYPGNEVMPVAAYLDQNIYDLDSRRFDSFHIPTDTNYISGYQVVIDTRTLVLASNTDALLILNDPINMLSPGSTSVQTAEVFSVSGEPLSSNQAAPSVTLTLTGRFEHCTVATENCYLYLVRRDSIGGSKGDKANGQGTFTFPNGTKYVGEMKDGEPSGQGTLTDANGSSQPGEWRDGRPYRLRGRYVATDGTTEVGSWNYDGTKCGGTITWKDGRVYKGDWKLVEGSPESPDGVGKMTYPDGKVQNGLWKQGQFMGAAQ